MFGRALALCLACALAACAYVLPASWRSFRADPDDAAPAVTRALDSRGIAVATFDQSKRQIVTEWVFAKDAIEGTRDRYIVSWERDEKEAALTIYVRHEAQDSELGDGGPKWSAAYHDTDRESALLDLIQKELADGE